MKRARHIDPPTHPPLKTGCEDDLTLTRCLGSKGGEVRCQGEHGIKPHSLWGSWPGSCHLYPVHPDWLKYLRRNKILGLSRTICWPQKQNHENSAASEVDGLKMVEAEKQGGQHLLYSTTTRGTRSHKRIQTVSQHRISFVGMVTAYCRVTPAVTWNTRSER